MEKKQAYPRPIRVLFFIPNLSHGGAEKVLVNLVNHMDQRKFAVEVKTLFNEGVNQKYLQSHIAYSYCFPKTFPANSQILKLFSPTFLYRRFIHQTYDIVVSYLEGPTARIVSGCPNSQTKLLSWIHVQQYTMKRLSYAFRNEKEAHKCYERFDETICVSKNVMEDFRSILNFQGKLSVLYNTNETKQILEKSMEEIPLSLTPNQICLYGVGKISKNKGFDRLARIHKRLIEDGFDLHTYVLGVGPDQEAISRYITDHHLENSFTFLGYQENPYRYMKRFDVFCCTSYAEGFSTATTEAMLLGSAVVTTDVAGMDELLQNGECGIIVKNEEEALYEALRALLQNPERIAYYQQKALERSKTFSTEKTVEAVEQMLLQWSPFLTQSKEDVK